MPAAQKDPLRSDRRSQPKLSFEAWRLSVKWIAPAPSREAVEFRFWLVEPRRGPLDLTSTIQDGHVGPAVVNGFQQGTGEVLVIFSAVWPLDQLRLESLDQARRMARAHLGPSFDLAPELGPRTAIFETADDGHANVWDLSLLQADSKMS